VLGSSRNLQTQRSLPLHRVSRVCGNAYFREERLSDLLRGVIEKVQLPEQVAASIAMRLRASQGDLEQARRRSSTRLLDQRAAKTDRGYDDYLEGRIADAFWKRKFAEWETELATARPKSDRLIGRRPSSSQRARGF
jgi:hypothetical protein